MIPGNLHHAPLFAHALTPAVLLIDPSLLTLVLKLALTYTVPSPHTSPMLSQFCVVGAIVVSAVVSFGSMVVESGELAMLVFPFCAEIIFDELIVVKGVTSESAVVIVAGLSGLLL